MYHASQPASALASTTRVGKGVLPAELADDPETEVIILTGAGRAFTVGLDLKELGGEVAVENNAGTGDLAAAIAAAPQPIITVGGSYADPLIGATAR